MRKRIPSRLVAHAPRTKPPRRLSTAAMPVLVGVAVLTSCGSSTPSESAEQTSRAIEVEQSEPAVPSPPTVLTATGKIDSCRATGEAVLSISGGELLAPWPKEGEVVDCTVRLDDSTLAGGKVEARLPNKLLPKVAKGGPVSWKVKEGYVLWSGAGMSAQVEVVSTAEGDWEVTRIVST